MDSPDVGALDRVAAVRPVVPAARAGARPPVRGVARVRRATRVTRRVLAGRWDVMLAISAGGAAGSLARWGIAVALPARGGFPWATFLANVTGSVVLGSLMVLVLDVWPPSRYLRPFLTTGVLGGYTTFSSFMLDTHTLLLAGRPAVAGVYLFASLAVGLVAVWLGVAATRLAVVLARRRARSRARSRARRRARQPSLTRSRTGDPR